MIDAAKITAVWIGKSRAINLYRQTIADSYDKPNEKTINFQVYTTSTSLDDPRTESLDRSLVVNCLSFKKKTTTNNKNAETVKVSARINPIYQVVNLSDLSLFLMVRVLNGCCFFGWSSQRFFFKFLQEIHD